MSATAHWPTANGKATSTAYHEGREERQIPGRADTGIPGIAGRRVCRDSRKTPVASIRRSGRRQCSRQGHEVRMNGGGGAPECDARVGKTLRAAHAPGFAPLAATQGAISGVERCMDRAKPLANDAVAPRRTSHQCMRTSCPCLWHLPADRSPGDMPAGRDVRPPPRLLDACIAPPRFSATPAMAFPSRPS